MNSGNKNPVRPTVITDFTFRCLFILNRIRYKALKQVKTTTSLMTTVQFGPIPKNKCHYFFFFSYMNMPGYGLIVQLFVACYCCRSYYALYILRQVYLQCYTIYCKDVMCLYQLPSKPHLAKISFFEPLISILYELRHLCLLVAFHFQV